MSKSNDEIIEELVLSGALEIEGIDPETNEFLYKITNKMKEVNKPLYDEHMNNVHAETMYFWEKGLVELDDFSSLNPKIYLTSKAFDVSFISSLPKEKIENFIRLKKALGVIGE